MIPAAGFRLRTVDAAGLKGIGGIQRLRNLLVLPRTAIEVAGILREFQPQVVVGVGGYLAGPVMLEAALVDIPTVLIEPNARPGFTNRLLAPMVRAAAVGFAETAHLYGEKAHVTGHPVRRAFFEIPPAPPSGALAVAQASCSGLCHRQHSQEWLCHRSPFLWWGAVKVRGRSTRPCRKLYRYCCAGTRRDENHPPNRRTRL